MKTLPLTKGYEALVDDGDFEALSQHKWSAIVTKGKVYAMRFKKRIAGQPRESVLMHRQLLGLERGNASQCDHRNGNGLDNTRANLRTSNQSENLCNRATGKRTKELAKGVFMVSGSSTFRAQIVKNGRAFHLGSFKTEQEARQAYCEAAKKLHGDFVNIE